MLIRKLRIGSPGIPLLLLTLEIAVWTEMDLFAPALPDIMHYFKTTEEVIQWTLSFNFFGFFMASLLCGAFSDAFGRRVVLLVGTALFVLGSLLTVTATQVEIFLLGRLIQGIGVSGPGVVVMAILADLYQGTLFIRWNSILNCLISSTMALAPIAGAYLTETYGWRSNFAVISLMATLGFISVWLWVPETLDSQNRKSLSLRLLVSDYWRLLKSKKFMAAMLGVCFFVTPYFVFVGVISLLFMNELKLSMEEYVCYQASIVAVFSLLSLCVSVFGNYLNLDWLMKVSVCGGAVSAIALVLHGLFLPDDALSLTGLMAVLAAALVVPCSVLFVWAIAVYPDLQASASALFQSVRMFLLSIGTAVAGAAYNGFYMPIGLITGFCVLIAVWLIVPLLREKTNAQNTSRVASAACAS